jgi:Fe-S oxidoreductase
MYLVRGLLEGKVDYSSDFSDLSYFCINCRACDNICEIIPIPKPHLRPTEIIRLLRYELGRRGLISNAFIRELYERVRKDGDLARPKMDVQIPKNMKNENSKYILFIGGVYSQGQRRIYDSALKLVQKLKLGVSVFIDEGSSGADLYDLGFVDELKMVLDKKKKLISKIAGKNLIFIDPHSQEFVLKHWQQYVETDKKMKGQHLSEVILNSLKGSKVRTKKVENVVVSYHDPCILGRGLGIYDAPRRLITSFEGVTLLEMKRNRRNSYCCGAGDGTRGKAFPEYSERVARERLEEFKETGADILITSCPYCKEMFQKILTGKKKRKVRDLIEFVNERIE